MRGRVEILAPKQDQLRLLAEVLASLSIGIVEVDDRHFVEGACFESLKSSIEVFADALRIEDSIGKIESIDPEVRCGLVIGNVIRELRTDGSQLEHRVLRANAGAMLMMGINATLTVTQAPDLSEVGRARLDQAAAEREFERRRRNAISRIRSALRDPRALKVQELLHGEPTPLALGHAVDLIQDDLGSAIRKLASDDRLTRFYRSINHQDVFGEDARHIASKQEPPPDPMTLSEARAFANEIAKRWMDQKAGLADADTN